MQISTRPLVSLSCRLSIALLVLTVIAPRTIWSQASAPSTQQSTLDKEIIRAETAAKANPRDPAAQAFLSQCYSVANRPQEALVAMELAIALAPTNNAYLQARAELANWTGRPGKAADSYERMLALDPSSTNTLLLLARARTWNGDTDRAAYHFRRYLRRTGDLQDVLMEYILVESWRGNFAEALDLLDRYERKFKRTPHTEQERARMLAGANKPRAALKIIDPKVKDSPDDFELQFMRTIALHYNNQPRAADTNLVILDRLRPENAEVTSLAAFLTASRRSDLTAHVRYYFDSDELKIWKEALTGGVQLSPESKILAGVEADQLSAPAGSGLANIDGTPDATYSKAWLGLRQIVTRSVNVEVSAGYAEVENRADETLVYRGYIAIRPCDSFKASLAHERDYLLISPRSTSLQILDDSTRLDAEWTPGLNYTVAAAGRYDAYTDGNERYEAVLGPRRSVLRSNNLNLDLGLRATLFGFQDDLNSGYYDPELYEQYAATAFGYWKFTPQSGLGVVGAAGYYKDETMSGYDFGWSVDAEATVGSFSDWMLKATGSAFQNFRNESSSGAFTAYAISASLTRRF